MRSGLPAFRLLQVPFHRKPGSLLTPVQFRPSAGKFQPEGLKTLLICRRSGEVVLTSKRWRTWDDSKPCLFQPESTLDPGFLPRPTGVESRRSHPSSPGSPSAKGQGAIPSLLSEPGAQVQQVLPSERTGARKLSREAGTFRSLHRILQGLRGISLQITAAPRPVQLRPFEAGLDRPFRAFHCRVPLETSISPSVFNCPPFAIVLRDDLRPGLSGPDPWEATV